MLHIKFLIKMELKNKPWPKAFMVQGADRLSVDSPFHFLSNQRCFEA